MVDEKFAFALTLAARKKYNARWLTRGMKRPGIMPRLHAYWSDRVGKDAEARALYDRIVADYEAAKAVKPTKPAEPVAPPPQPTPTEMASSLALSLTRWAARGFKLATAAQTQERLAVCRGCPLWDAQAFGGTGKCRKCGCSTAAKLRLAHEKCPDGHWGPVAE